MTSFDPNFKIGLDEAIAKYEDLEAVVLANLAALNIIEPHRPMMQTTAGMIPFTGELPPNLPSLSDTELGDLLGKLSEMQNHLGYQLAKASLKHTIVSNQLEDVAANLRILYKKDEADVKRPEQERKDMTRTDRRYVEANSREIYYDAFHSFVKAAYTATEQNYTAVSRRITQRGQDVQRDSRGAAVNAAGPPVFRRPGM